jgi:aminoglycoside phosphotransferase (APT) family kinase protein
MHVGELPTDVETARRLLSSQFPEWAHLALVPGKSGGTVHAIYRLGDRLQMRLPRLAEWGSDPDRETRSLQRLAPRLPIQIPTPVGVGRPDDEYPAAWTLFNWIDGEMAQPHTVDQETAAIDLARFITALQAIDTLDAPHNTHRGGPLQGADADTRAAIDTLPGDIDRDAVAERWERALLAPAWDRPAVWTHGDLWHSNLLVDDSRIVAVIDFGSAGIGDPAIDSIVAWSLLTAGARELFRATLGIDDATWERGIGWAISMAALALPYYRDTNSVIVANSRRMLQEILAAHD